MSRTIRRGKPSRNVHKYIGLGVIREEHDAWSYWTKMGCWFSLGFPYWKDNADDQRTYEEYCRDQIRFYHSENYWPRSTGLPRHYRKLDNDKQKHRHFMAIHKAMRSGDYDVVLEGIRKEASWLYY